MELEEVRKAICNLPTQPDQLPAILTALLDAIEGPRSTVGVMQFEQMDADDWRPPR